MAQGGREVREKLDGQARKGLDLRRFAVTKMVDG
jgi:hypothetical protein